MSRFEDKLVDWIASHRLFSGCQKVLLAVSGGADSVAMAHVLSQLRRSGRLECEFVIGHVNHGLRGAQSDGDEGFVSELGRQLHLEVHAESVPVRDYAAEQKLSIETAGRILRLKALAAMAQANGCDAIATAHHADDLAETIIHRLMRGTGFRGLCGIRPVSVVYDTTLIRPMLDVRRDEIIQYAGENNLSWREDASNRNIHFTRNRIRHRLLPVFEKESGSLADLLTDLSAAACRFSVEAEKQAQDLLDKAIVENRPDCISLEKGRLRKCPPWVFYELARKVLMRLNTSLRKYTQEHFITIYRLMSRSQATISMPDGIQVFTKNGILGFCKDTAILPLEPVQLEIGQTVKFGCWGISARLIDADQVNLNHFLSSKSSYVEWFDAERITGPIEIRPRRDGDRFWPIGTKSSKKAGRFLMDAGLDAETRRDTFVVADAEKILWLAPLRMSEPVKVTGTTRKILELSVERG